MADYLASPHPKPAKGDPFMPDTCPMPSRRQFLIAAGLTAAGTAGTRAGADDAKQPVATATAAHDTPRQLAPSKSDLGNLFPEVHELAQGNRPAWSFLGGRFGTFAEFQRAAREKAF